MASPWSELRDGVLRKFCFLEVDLAGHSEIARNNPTRDAEATFHHFLDFLEEHVRARGGQVWSLAGDGGLFAFYDDDVTEMAEQAVASALAILDDLPHFNAAKSRVKEQVRARIAVHLGDARYFRQTGRIQSDDINFLAHLEKKATSQDSVSISWSVYRELVGEELRSRFRERGTFEGRLIYTSVLALVGVEDAAAIPAPEAPPAPWLPADKGKRHAVVVGVSHYEDEAIPDLRYAAQDAQSFSELLVELGGFPREQLTSLTEVEATLKNLKMALSDLRATGPEDLVVFYFAGHGCADVHTANTSPGDCLTWKYLVPCDAHRDYLEETALSMDELRRRFSDLACKRRVVLLDSCYSGAGGRSFATLGARGNFSDALLDDIAGEQCAVLAASDVNELAFEREELGHGLFTYYLLKGLRGEADVERRGAVTVKRLYEYLCACIPPEAEKLGGRQHPVLKGNTNLDIPLTFLPALPLPSRPEPLQQAEAHYAAGRHAEAIQVLQAYLPQAGAAQGEVYRWLGKTHLARGDAEAALAAYEAAVAQDPTNPEGHAGRGEALLSAGQFDGAVEACRQAIEIDPRCRDLLFKLQFRLEQELGHGPHEAKPYLSLARVRSLQGREELALAYLRQAAESWPLGEVETLERELQGIIFFEFRRRPEYQDLRALLEERKARAAAAEEAEKAAAENRLRQENLKAFRASSLPEELARRWAEGGGEPSPESLESALGEAGCLPLDIDQARAVVKQVYGAIRKREAEVREGLRRSVQEARAAIAAGDCAAARQGIARLRNLDPNAPELGDLQRDLEREEEGQRQVQALRSLLANRAYEEIAARFQGQPELARERAEAGQILRTAQSRLKAIRNLRDDLEVVSRLAAAGEGIKALCLMSCLCHAAKYREMKEQMAEKLAALQARMAEELKQLAGRVPEDMALIPAGHFVMGRPGEPEESAGASCCHAFLDHFALDRHEVTNSAYREFLEFAEREKDHPFCHPDQSKGKSHCPDGWERLGNEDDHKPVVGIDWYDAYAYAAWKGRRLPTEAEWEKGGFWDEAQGHKRFYPWGDQFDPRCCNSASAPVHGPAPVGRFTRGVSGYGLFDMCGNVWEWCADWYASDYIRTAFLEAPLRLPEKTSLGDRPDRPWALNPKGARFKDGRVVRGGSWLEEGKVLGLGCRSRAYPLCRSEALGFRCALSLGPEGRSNGHH